MTSFEIDHGDVPVDSGQLLIVDPCHLPAELLKTITEPNKHGISAGLVITTSSGDGWYGVVSDGAAGLESTTIFKV